MKNKKINLDTKFILWLLGIYVVLFTALAFNPIDRATWFVENLTVWIIIAFIAILYFYGIRFSRMAYLFASMLIYLHTIGGRFTFALVPFDFVTDFFGFERNHYDRIAHFTVGFYAFPIVEWLASKKLVVKNP